MNTLASPNKKNPKKPRRKRWFLGFLVFSMIAAFLLTESRLVLDEPESKMDVPTLHADCGVVLTGSSGRIREAIEILAQKRIKKLIVSGVFKEAQLNEIFPHLAFYPEISDQDIYLEKKSATTYGNAIQSLALVEALRCRDIVLVTSQIHMYRANRIFTHIFPSTIPIKKMSVPNKKDFTFFDYLLETLKVTLYWALGLVY